MDAAAKMNYPISAKVYAQYDNDRLDCLARHVANMPTLADRRDYFERLAKKCDAEFVDDMKLRVKLAWKKLI